MSVKFEFNEDAIRKAAIDAAKEQAKSMKFDVECPHCHATVNVPSGKHPCPKCGKTIDLKLNFSFD